MFLKLKVNIKVKICNTELILYSNYNQINLIYQHKKIVHVGPFFYANISLANNVIIGSDIKVLVKNTINKSFKLKGISDFNITAPVSVKYIS